LNDVLSLIATMIIGVIFLLTDIAEMQAIYYFLAVAVIVLAMILMHPKIFYPLLNSVFKKMGKEALPKDSFYTYKHIMVFLCLYLATSVLRALAFYFFATSIAQIPNAKIITIMGIYSFATALGVLAIFAPNGLGVKEGSMLVLLSSIMSSALASFVSVLSRIWYILAQVLLFIIVWSICKIRQIAVYKQKNLC